MRTITIVLPLLLTGTALAQNPNPITPAETAESVGKRVTVEFVAKSNGFNAEGEGFSELGSEKEFENKAWFALRFSRKAMAELAKNGITDLGYYVEDKVVATGVVKEIDFGAKYGKRRFIYIDDVSQFKATPTKKPLPKEVIAAWEKAGADTGWMGPRWQLGVTFSKERVGFDLGRTVPAFRFPAPQGFPLGVWPEGLATLPAPEQAFGLELRGATDEKVKELARLKQLTSLHLSFSQLTEAGVKELAGMKQLTSLHLNVGSPLLGKNRPFTDADLKELAGMKQLTSLELPFTTQVTDAGLKELAGMKLLTSLHLTNNVKVTDAGLKELAGLERLTFLNLNHTRVSDAGLKELAGLKQLTYVGLWSTKVTDAGLKELAGLEQLTTLNLKGTQVTGTGLKELAGLKRLTSLQFGGSQVTEDGLKELAGLKQLTTLYLMRSPVTEAGIEKLREALPKCRISFSGRVRRQ